MARMRIRGRQSRLQEGGSMKVTKLVALLVLIALVVSLLVGCSPKRTEGPPEVPAGAENIKPPAPVATPADFAALAAQMSAKAKELKSWRAEIITERAKGGGTMATRSGSKTLPNPVNIRSLIWREALS